MLPPTVQGVLVNTGQSCIAPTRILVHKDREAEAVGVIVRRCSTAPGRRSVAEGAHIGPVVNKTQFDKIQGLIQSAIDEGATLETGGTGLPTNVNRGYYHQADGLLGRHARHAHRQRGNLRPCRDDHGL